jgi:hypothetical protein
MKSRAMCLVLLVGFVVSIKAQERKMKIYIFGGHGRRGRRRHKRAIRTSRL